jgi:hypothetical protein
MKRIYPEKKLTWENVENYNFDIAPKHPQWVQDYFPLILIYHKEKAGALRKPAFGAKSISIAVMYQNNQNVMTQLVMTADDFGLYYRKNRHKGYNNIVAAISATEEDMAPGLDDQQKPLKFKNFFEFGNVFNANDPILRLACEELEKFYPCDSVGQIRLF